MSSSLKDLVRRKFQVDMVAMTTKTSMDMTAAIWNWKVYYHTAIEAAMTCGGAENFVTAMGGPAAYPHS